MTRTAVMLAVVMLAWLGPGAMAQEVTVSAQLSRMTAYVGDDVVLEIVVDGATEGERPEFRLPEGLSSEFLGARPRSSVFTQITNGQVRERRELQYQFQYRLSAQRPGTYTIPAVDVVVRGQTLRTQPIELRVREPAEAAGFEMEASFERERVWIGEVIRVRGRWRVPAEVSGVSFEASVIPDGFMLLPSPAPQLGGARDRFEFTLRGQSVTALVEPTANGVDVVFELRLLARRPGRARLGPLAATFTTAGPRATRERLITRSTPIEIEVLELPDSPPGFSGLVGSFDLGASLERRTANVGDPLTLTLQIVGPEPMLGAGSEPPVVLPPELLDGFTLAPGGWQRLDDRSGLRRYQTTVRPNRADVERLPPIALIVFDPAREGYVTQSTEAIPLTVRTAREVTAADAVGRPAQVTDGQSGPQDAMLPERAGRAIWAEDRGPELLRDRTADWPFSPGVLLAVAGGPPAAAGLAMLGLAAVRSRRTDRARALGRIASARRLWARGERAEAVRELTGASLGLRSEAVAAYDVERLRLDEVDRRTLRLVLVADEGGEPASSPARSDGKAFGRAARSLASQIRAGDAP